MNTSFDNNSTFQNTNESFIKSSNVTDFYDLIRENSANEIIAFVKIAFVLGVLIIVCNLPVVISSGLILKKGQKPKCTYILLGNVSLADTIVGFSIIFGVSYEAKSEEPLCALLMGLVVLSAMVSIFSVGFIAVDRYIYIVHGLYYGRWINTTRVRYGILVIWIIAITLSFLPGFGWVNEELYSSRCYYITLFPGKLILINSFLSIVPIVVVVILYSIILVKALNTVKTIKGTVKKEKEVSSHEKPQLRMYRGTVNIARSQPTKPVIKRSVSFDMGPNIKLTMQSKSRTLEDLTNIDFSTKETKLNIDTPSVQSDYSISTDDSNLTIDSPVVKVEAVNNCKKSKKSKSTRHYKEPNKWRAITVVMLTSGSFIITWMPFFIIVVFYIFCEDKTTNPTCLQYRILVSRHLCILGFLNSLLNPLIYAWWHKGFKSSVRSYYRKVLRKCRG